MLRSTRRGRALGTTVLSGALCALLLSPAMAAPVTKERLENADREPQNWITGFQNYSSHRFSRLDQINRTNVGNLKVVFTLPMPTAFNGRTNVQLENYPLVDDGFLYYDDAAGNYFKVDARGPAPKIVWKADAALNK